MIKLTENGYITSISTTDRENDVEYLEMLEIFKSKPKAESGFDYRLREDLKWEKYKLPEIPEISEDEATAEDYENALKEVGVL